MTLHPGNIVVEQIKRIRAGLESGTEINAPFPTEKEEQDTMEWLEHLRETTKNYLIAEDIYDPDDNPNGTLGRDFPHENW